MPPAIRANVFPWMVTFGLEDGSGVSYRKNGRDRTEFVLTKVADGSPAGRLAPTFPEPDIMVLEGSLDGQNVRMTFRRIPQPPKKEYQLRSRGFRWVQEHPYNR